MTKHSLLHCATDKEIFDVLMSSKQKITDTVLLDLAKGKGIFYSPNDNRETLASEFSLLVHDYYALNALLDLRDHAGRSEKITSVTLNTALTIDEIKEASHEFKKSTPSDENVIAYQEGTDKYVVKVEYSEIDYSKTHLLQRRQKEAGIEFIVEKEKTVVRMPANMRAKEFASKIKNHLDSKKSAAIPSDMIELVDITSPIKRTQFFTALISKLEGFSLVNVTSVKVQSSMTESQEDDLDIEDNLESEEARKEMLAIVKNVALKGQSLLSSTEYKQLKDRGFYITDIVWKSEQKTHPYPIIEFEAGFDEADAGKGFKYNVRGEYKYSDGEHTKHPIKVATDKKQLLLTLIEQTSRKILNELRAEIIKVGDSV